MVQSAGDPGWSVEFVIGDDERVGMDYAGPRVVGPEHYLVVRPWSDDEGPSTLRIDVSAQSAEEAKHVALDLYRRMRIAAELGVDPTPTVTMVARIVGRPHPWDRYIFAAGEMLGQGQYALAVVAAQIHCEMFIRHAVPRAARHDGSRTALAVADLLQSATLMDRTGAKVFETLLGTKPNLAPCWSRYCAHVTRRNRIVHQGMSTTAADAQDSIDSAVAMVKFVDEHLQARLSSRGDSRQSPTR